MPVKQLPFITLQSEHAGHAKRDRKRFLAATNLRPHAFNFNDAREIFRQMLGNEFDTCHFAMPIVRRSSGQLFSNILASVCKGSKRIAKRHVLTLGIQREIAAWITIHNPGECAVALFNRAVERVCAHRNATGFMGMHHG